MSERIGSLGDALVFIIRVLLLVYEIKCLDNIGTVVSVLQIQLFSFLPRWCVERQHIKRGLGDFGELLPLALS